MALPALRSQNGSSRARADHPLGPKGQEIIRRRLKPSVESFLFSPADNMAEFRAWQRQQRKTKVQPSQSDRRKTRLQRRPGERYTPQAYGQAIAQVIKRHNRGKPASEQIPHWHPHQLRHLRALELKREAGLDVARAVLGHRSPILTEHYAGLDIAKATDIVGRIG